MTQREWILNKLRIFYVEPYLTELNKWSDSVYPLDGSFQRKDLDLIREYLVDKVKVVDSTWDISYMTEVFNAWDLLVSQYPDNVRKVKAKKEKRLFKHFMLAQAIENLRGREGAAVCCPLTPTPAAAVREKKKKKVND